MSAHHGQTETPTDRRSDERRECCLAGRIKSNHDELSCAINDLASNGLGLTVNSSTRLKIGEAVTVTAQEFGSIAGAVRWAAHPRYGIAFANADQMSPSFQRYLHSLNAEEILKERISFLQIDAATLERIRGLKDILERELPIGLDHFYERVRATPGVRTFFSSEQLMVKAKGAQLGHWTSITSGRFDTTYYNNVRRIGKTHARIGLEPRWYINGYALLLSHLVKAMIAERWPRGFLNRGTGKDHVDLGESIAALVKAVFLDMDVSISVYLDESAQARLEGEAEAIELERNLVAGSIGEGLSKLAEKALTHRMTEELPDAYRSLQSDFNRALEQLEEALKVVGSTSDSVLSGSREITRASDDLSRQTEQQAASLEETVAALNEITLTVKKTAENAKHAREIVSAARTDAERSGNVVQKAVAAMAKIETSSQQISQIIGVIDEIAFQTNLLALNAGVEAARAGEAGRGFAVVASEVRALAQRSAEAAKEIKALIANSTAQVSEGVQLVDETGRALDGIVQKVADINDLMSKIATVAQEQSMGLQEVNSAMSQMDEMTQRNAAMAEETTAVSHSLSQETERLASLIDQFDITPDHRAPAKDDRKARTSEGAPLRRAG